MLKDLILGIYALESPEDKVIRPSRALVPYNSNTAMEQSGGPVKKDRVRIINPHTHEGKVEILRGHLQDLKDKFNSVKTKVKDHWDMHGEEYKKTAIDGFKQGLREGIAEAPLHLINAAYGPVAAGTYFAAVDPKRANAVADAAQSLVGHVSPRAQKEMRMLRTGYHSSITSPINARVNRMQKAVVSDLTPTVDKVKSFFKRVGGRV